MPKPASKDIINILNDVLTAELTAVNQYFLHAEMCGDWGYKKLHDKIRAESIDEMRHAQDLIDRILYLGGVPNVQRLSQIHVGKSVKEQLENDLKLEYEAIPRLNTGIDSLRQVGDNGSRLLLESILTSEEEHIEWLEAQLEQIKQMGEQNYLQAQA